MDIRMLGPLQVTVDGQVVHLPARQRSILAMLALQPNRAVSADRLIDGLWGEDEPATAPKTLQSHMFQLRRQLASTAGSSDTARISTQPNGYCLVIDAEAIDVQRFEHELERGRQMLAADPGAARDVLRDALSLWQGAALADFAYEPFAESEIRRLDELHLQAVEELATAQLALGEHEAVVGDLRHAVVEAPYAERLHALLMIGLVRSGRSAEALVAYRDLETRLRLDLDTEPGGDLQALAGRIRSGDPSLLAPEAAGPLSPRPAPAGAAPPAARIRRPFRPAYLALGAVAVTLSGLAVILGIRQVTPSGASEPLPSPSPSASASFAFDTAERDLLERLPLRIRDACQPSTAGESLPRSAASLTCPLEGSDARSVVFDSFDPALASLAFGDLERAAGSPTDACAISPNGAGKWTEGLLAGRVLCYEDDGASRIVWTYETDIGRGLIGRAWRQDDDWSSLYSWWVMVRAFIRH